MNYVYIHTNKKNGKKYVGLTTQKPYKRWQGGAGYLRKKNGVTYDQPAIAAAIIKYGWDNFDHQVFEVNTREEMKYLEKYLIAYYETTNPKKGYNISTGGDWVGRKCSEETKEKLRQFRLGTHLSEETRKKLSAVRLGRKDSEATLAKKRARKGEKRSETGRSAIAKANVETKGHPVIAIAGDVIINFPSIKAAAGAVGVAHSSIRRAIDNPSRVTKGYHWKFKNE